MKMISMIFILAMWNAMAGETPSGLGAAPGDQPARPDAPQPVRKGSFTLHSPEVKDGGQLPKEYTGDGNSATLPLDWSGAPQGTKSFALIMHHVAPDKTKWYWVLYNIPSDVKSLPKNVKGIGALGNNSVNGRTEYAPPHSKGPGPKTYVYTLYALSAAPQLNVPPEQVSRDVLLAAMKDRVLAAVELKVVYSRPEGSTDQEDGRRPPPPPKRNDPNEAPDSDDRPMRDDHREK